MEKIGRNAPCPCGSGKKYKRCCGAGSGLATITDSAPASAPIRDRRALERSLLDVGHLLNEQQFGSIEEANAYLQDLLAGGELPRHRPTSPLEQAQDLMYDAWDAVGRQRVKLARKALQVSRDCADAYVLLAEETARSLPEALDLYRQGVAAGERALGPAGFEEYAGQFWGVIETRPYMRARLGLAQCLWAADHRDEAIDHYRDMLRLNPGDNQGVRYMLLPALLEVGDQAGAEELLERYPEDAAASWAYGRALLAFQKQGDTRSSRAALTKARKVNPYVPDYLLGTKQLPARLPDYVGFGDESEAVSCAAELLPAWSQAPGAPAWLERSIEQPRGRGRGAPGRERDTVPKDMRPHFDALVQLTDAVCQKHLNDEYAQLCRHLAAALCRKRPSPVTRGRLESWACGIAYTIGSVNFLFDKSQEPHLMASELCALFGVGSSTGAAKASEIRKMFRMGFYDPEWCLPSKLDDNPLAWMIMVDGMIVDARHAPREIQEEALRLGLIPHLPDSPPT